MAELPHQQPEYTAKPHSLYVRKLSRFSFQAIGELREAFLEMYNEPARRDMGQRALFLYSQSWLTDPFRPGSDEHKASDHLDSVLSKRLKTASVPKQFDVAKWIEPYRPEGQGRTGFQLNVLLDTGTQEQLHASLKEGLNQTLFGRRAISATLWIPDTDIAPTPDQRRDASLAIKQVVWGEDELDTPPTLLGGPERGIGAKVAHIAWKPRIIDGSTNQVA
jgi:hypothetical protein